MAQNGGKPAVEVDFSDFDEAQAWFQRQSREVWVAFAMRSALCLLPLIETVHDTPDGAPRVTLSVFRACFVAWVVAKYPPQRNRLQIAANAANSATAATADLAIGYADANIAGANGAAINATYAVTNAVTHAVSAAAANARYAATTAYAGPAIRADAVAIEQGRPIAEIVAAPLWLGGMPGPIFLAWDRLRTWMLEDESNNWEPWVQWYERVRDGRPSFGEAFDLAVASLTDEEWNEEPRPAAVNRRIAALLAEHTSPDPIPPQGPGPHVIINAAGKLDQAPPEDIDADGNNVRRIRELLPDIRDAAADLAGNLNPNLHPELARIVVRYREVLGSEGEAISWGRLWGLGVRLQNAADAARREISDRIHDPLEDAAQEALASLLRHHGPLINATHEGRELSDEADRFELSRDQIAAMRRDAEAILAGLKKATEIVEPVVEQIVEGAAETVGDGRHQERGAVYWMGTARNLTTVLVPASALAALAWLVGGVGGEAIKIASGLLVQENARIREAAKSLGTEYNRLVDVAFRTARDQGDLATAQAIARLRLLTPFRDFVIANEAPLRRIAAYSPSLRWMLWYIDFVLRTNDKR